MNVARQQLRSDLEKSAKAAVAAKDFAEVQRISTFLQSEQFGSKPNQGPPASRVLAQLRLQTSKLEKELAAYRQADPIVGAWNYNNGNTCDYLADGTVMLGGKQTAIWRRTKDGSYLVAFIERKAADRLQLLPDGRTIALTGPGNSKMRLDRVNR